MRILIHSNAPWACTGYAQQTALFAPRLSAMGHEVAVSAFYGLQGRLLTWRDGLIVYPRYADRYGNDAITGHAAHFKADLVLTLSDVWVLDPGVFGRLGAAAWVPVDCDPLSRADKAWFEKSGCRPIAMSLHGKAMLEQAGLTALYIPHGVDTAVFAPADRTEIRERFGIPADAFVVGMNSANKGTSPSRKAFAEQFSAFARLAKRHDDALLLLHTDVTENSEGIDLIALARSCGVPEGAVQFSDQYTYRIGGFPPEYVAALYNACDVVSNATYGEGFGLATIEAQACGVPVVVTDNSASSELCGAGWKVPGVRYWNEFHRAWWSAPDVNLLAKTLEKAYDGGAAKRGGSQAREFALGYDADRVACEWFKPALDVLGEAVSR